MSISLNLKRVTKQDDGSYAISLSVTRDGTSEVVGTKTIEINSAAEFKSKVQPVFESLIEVEQNRTTMEGLVQGVIDEIMAEVTQ